jgi:hypothetical protein
VQKTAPDESPSSEKIQSLISNFPIIWTPVLII